MYPFGAPVGVEVDQHGAQATFDVGVPVEADDAQTRLPVRAKEVAQQEQRRLVGPVQVVEDHEDRAPGRHLVQGRRHGLEEAEAVAVGLAAGQDPVDGVLGQPEYEARQLGQAPLGDEQNLVGGERTEVAPQRLGEGLERGDGVLVTASGEHQGACPVGGADELGHQARLSDSRLAADQEEAGFAPLRPPTTRQRTTFGLPPDQRSLDHRRRRRHRDLRAFLGDGLHPRRLGADPIEVGALSEDGPLQPHDIVPRLDPELVHQGGPELLEDAQGLGLPTGTVKGQHALRPQPFAHRVFTGESFELADDRPVPAQGELSVELGLDCGEAEFLEPPRLGPGEWFVADLAVGGTPPERLRLLEQPGGFLGVSAGQLAAPPGHQPFEPEHVAHLRLGDQRVPRRSRHDELVFHAGIAEALAQPRHRRTQRYLGAVSRMIGPQRVEQAVD